jgi:DNA-binding XRE family transcriptional regulator
MARRAPRIVSADTRRKLRDAGFAYGAQIALSDPHAPTLKRLRVLAGMTVDELAVRSNLSASTLARAEAGKPTTERTWRAVADVLGYSVETVKP